MNRPQHCVEKANSAWASFQRIAFEQGGLEAVFSHIRNLVISTLIMAAGADAIKHALLMPLYGILDFDMSGYGVAATGVALVILNLLDGLQKLARTKTPLTLRVLAILLYVLFSIRVAQLIVAFRTS
jgi:hypothetical protein